MEKKSFKGYLYLAPALVIISVFVVYPLIRAVIMSFMENYNFVSGEYDGINLNNYVSIFHDKYFIRALTNTMIYVVFVVPFSIILSLLIAVILHSKIHFRGVFQTIYFLPYVTSTIAIGLVWKWIFNSDFGLINQVLGWFGIAPVKWLTSKEYALPSLIIFSIWRSCAFDILIFLSALQTIPDDLYNAAKVDSTPRRRVFTRITLPAIAPMISYAFIMGLINAFKVYNEVYALFGGQKAGPANSAITVVYYIYSKFYNETAYGEAAAAAVVLFGIVLTLTIIQRTVTSRANS
ncbi:MAG: carbohydrate ABC transporter permease [Lachnospiraceae bacterium]